MRRSGLAVQRKGFAPFPLCSSMKSKIAFSSCPMKSWTPRREPSRPSPNPLGPLDLEGSKTEAVDAACKRARVVFPFVYGLAAGHNPGLEAAASGTVWNTGTSSPKKRASTSPASTGHHPRPRRNAPRIAQGRDGVRFMIRGERSKADHVRLGGLNLEMRLTSLSLTIQRNDF